MNYRNIPSAFYDIGRATHARLVLYLRNNFKHNEERILAQEATTPDLPAGFILAYAGATAPTGYLMCDGSLLVRATYPDLFAIIGTNYNQGGDASTHFRLPDMRGRAPMGVGTSTEGTVRAMGAAMGTETHVLTEAQLPVHTHTKNDPGHFHYPAQRRGGAGGLHPMIEDYYNNSAAVASAFQSPFGAPVASSNAGYTSVNSTGSGGAHNNMQPSVALNYIIKT